VIGSSTEIEATGTISRPDALIGGTWSNMPDMHIGLVVENMSEYWLLHADDA
jgi:hypothetical protein